jgi:large subunit ribosomal protein L32
MSVPPKRRTSSKVGRRRSHDALKKINLQKCKKCGQPIKPHHACLSCGTYKGREAVKVKTKAKKKKKNQ